MKRTFIILFALAVILSIFFFRKGDGGNSSEMPDFVKAQRGDMVISLKESGLLNAVEEITIKNEITYKSLNVLEVVADGTYVEEGDFLLELDSEPLIQEQTNKENSVSDKALAVTEAENTLAITQSETESAVISAENKIEFARLDLEKFEKLDKIRQIDEALQAIDIAKDQLNFSKQGYDASVELAAKGFETKSKVDRDRLDLSAKEKQLKSAEAKYDMLEQYDLHKEKLQLTRNLEEAKSKSERTEKEGDIKIQRAQAKLDNAKESLERAEEDLAEINEQLEKTVIHAPLSGYALYPQVRYYQRDRKMVKGKAVKRGESLIRIPNMSQMKVDIEVAEHFVSDLKVGQVAIITIDSLKGQEFAGKLGNVSLLPIQEESWNQSGVQKYKVVIDITDDSLPATIKPQISASTEVILDTLKDVLSVPIQAVHTVKGKQTVYVRQGGSSDYEAREIEIGKMDTNYIQIINGVEENEEVLISEPVL